MEFQIKSSYSNLKHKKIHYSHNFFNTCTLLLYIVINNKINNNTEDL